MRYLCKGEIVLVHQYKLNGFNIVLDTCSGAVHVVDEVAYDIIELFPEKSTEEIVKELPPKPVGKGSELDYQKAVEYYSALALSIRNKEGESQSFAKTLLKTASLHAKLGHKKDTETLLDRVLYLGAKDGMFTVEFGRLCDRAGRIYAEAGSRDKAEFALRQAYQIQATAGKCMTKEGHSLLLRLLQEKGDETAYLSVKNGEKLE